MRIGIDILDVDRMKNCIGTEKLSKIFTQYEMDYCHGKNWDLETAAGIYCAKEAFFKALGTGIVSPSHLLDVEVKHEYKGAPYYRLSSRIVTEHRLSTSKIHLSISHTKNVAVAVCAIIHL